MKKIPLKALLVGLLASALMESLIMSMVLVSSDGAMYVALVALFGMSLLFAGCAIHLARRMARLKLW